MSVPATLTVSLAPPRFIVVTPLPVPTLMIWVVGAVPMLSVFAFVVPILAVPAGNESKLAKTVKCKV